MTQLIVSLRYAKAGLRTGLDSGLDSGLNTKFVILSSKIDGLEVWRSTAVACKDNGYSCVPYKIANYNAPGGVGQDRNVM